MKFINKRHLICFVIISILFTSLLGCTQNVSNMESDSVPLTMEEKLEDFEYLYKIISENFDYFHISPLTIKPVDSIGFEGNIYLLVDRGVYSSTESFSVFCKDSGFATLVGETTGGDGIGIDPLLFSLPNSGIVVRFSSLLALNGDGSINEEVQTTPNVLIKPKVIVKDANTVDDLILDDLIQYVIND